MKICTITCSIADNHGARLQTLALAEFLNGNGHPTEVIDYRPDSIRFGMKALYLPRNAKDLVKLFVQLPLRLSYIRRHRQFAEFSQRHIPITSTIYDSYDSLVSSPPHADVYIAGSDQIWNTYSAVGRDKGFYLAFGPTSTKRISYAASFSHKDIHPEMREPIKQLIGALDAVSVREQSGVSILRSMGLDGVKVVDPVFLMPRDYWGGQTEDSPFVAPRLTKPYLLVCDFERSDQVRRVAQRVARLRNLKIYSVSPRRLGYAHKNFNKCTTEQFVSLLRDASCIVCNSFHTSAFALIFEKDFYVVNRNDGLNTRMAELTSQYGISERLVTVDTPDGILTSNIDYSKVTPTIAADIERSKKWLLDELIIPPAVIPI